MYNNDVQKNWNKSFTTKACFKNSYFDILLLKCFPFEFDYAFKCSGNEKLVRVVKDCFSLDILLVPKTSKRHFFGDISNSFQWVTQMGLEPYQNFSFKKISKNKAASPILRFYSFGGKSIFSSSITLIFLEKLNFI